MCKVTHGRFSQYCILSDAYFSVETINTPAALKILPESYQYTSTAALGTVIFKYQRPVFHTFVLFRGHGRHFNLRREK